MMLMTLSATAGEPNQQHNQIERVQLGKLLSSRTPRQTSAAEIDRRQHLDLMEQGKGTMTPFASHDAGAMRVNGGLRLRSAQLIPSATCAALPRSSPAALATTARAAKTGRLSGSATSFNCFIYPNGPRTASMKRIGGGQSQTTLGGTPVTRGIYRNSAIFLVTISGDVSPSAAKRSHEV